MRYPHDHENDVIYFGKVNFRNKLQTFGIKTDDRRRHVYVVGKTGMGKTTLLENMILSDIYAGHGCAYIDPHGDTAEKILDYIPSWRINDVVYFNPADIEYPIGFNILESVDEKMKHLVAAGMMSVFKKLWEGVWSARMEYILNNTILALMDTPNTTLLGINRMLSDDKYRKEIISNVKDPIVKQFWVMEFESYQSKFASEAVAPIQNKVGQFLSASIIRNIVAQAKSSMNMREIMDGQKILLVNLSKGRIGEDSSRLLGGLLITKLQMSAMERVDMPEEERQDFYMFVDEFQNFAVESFASILSEARKYRLNLVMAHQYIAQLTEEVRDAVFGNVGTLISFRVGGPDAAFMEEEFMPRFLPNDMINLPKFSIYLKLMIDGVTSQPFSALTLPPIAVRTGSEQKVIEQSRERYSGEKEKIEEKVEVWSGFGKDVDIEQEYEKAKQGKKDAKKARFSHEYTCTRCSKAFPLPVELDRSRPIYCEDCHPIIMEERKSGKKRGGEQRGRREETKRVVATPPKVDDGEVIQKDTGKSVGLSALSDDKIKEKKERRPEPKREKPEVQAREMVGQKSEPRRQPKVPSAVEGKAVDEVKVEQKTDIKSQIKVPSAVEKTKVEQKTEVKPDTSEPKNDEENQKISPKRRDGDKVEKFADKKPDEPKVEEKAQSSEKKPDRPRDNQRSNSGSSDSSEPKKRNRRRRNRSKKSSDRSRSSEPQRQSSQSSDRSDQRLSAPSTPSASPDTKKDNSPQAVLPNERVTFKEE
ncbi:type IV secretion system DNA-binding domain-containing protein [Candidatus Uhrbacteria bacterium]|nr:type IV secretion system DNA-binding domain-containing protein [Candidatus Uhrbacteria bacterium]MBT7717232.1 type IV secretion system DNA-binding domain-containing protein [Candidatus Uhrbacteria bacterium]